MRRSTATVSEAQLRRDYPIANLVEGWLFRQREVSAGCYVAEGRDRDGREVSGQPVAPEDALRKCVAYAQALK
jgi:hypothetical protein